MLNNILSLIHLRLNVSDETHDVMILMAVTVPGCFHLLGC